MKKRIIVELVELVAVAAAAYVLRDRIRSGYKKLFTKVSEKPIVEAINSCDNNVSLADILGEDNEEEEVA